MKKFIMLLMLTILAFPLISADRVVLEKNNFVVLNRDFNQESTAQVMSDLMKILYGENELIAKTKIPLLSQPKVIYLILETPGGEVVAGLKMFDFLLAQNVEIKTVTLFAASMGFHAVQSLGERLITRSGTLMTHKARGGFQGEFAEGSSQLDSRYNYWLRRIDRMDKEVVKRTNGLQTMESYRKLMENEYWCEGQHCVEIGFADKVIDLTCGSSLMKTKIQKTNMNFFGIPISAESQVSECPLIGPMSVHVNIANITEGFESLYSNKIDKKIIQFVEKELGIK